ncbi:MAG: PCRF domain-containing protein, partial [Oscillospiraceae bacterium]|nr:PCRF domain-containing protein [Oscillospiraceae bacterium]
MFEKLKLTEQKYEEISNKLTDPEVIGDNKLYASLMKEYKNLTPVVEKYREYVRCKKTMEDARELLDEAGGDKEMKELAQLEFDESREALETLGEELKILLLPKDPNDEKNVIIEIRGGAGGEEASLFAGSLYRMYTMYAEARRWKTEILNALENDRGGFKEVSCSVEGDG